MYFVLIFFYRGAKPLEKLSTFFKRSNFIALKPKIIATIKRNNIK
jgi:hypothetical protein